MNNLVFGGAFDPPHLDHIKIVENILAKKIVDRIIFLPVKEHAFNKKMASSADRLAMLQQVLKEHFSNQPVEVWDFELKQSGLSITYNTLEELAHLYPHDQFSFLIGSDNLENFHQWHHYQDLLSKYPVYVYPRFNYSFADLRPGMMALTELPEMKISSTEIKKKLAHGQNIDHLVSPVVARYISGHHLYGV